MIKWEYNHAKEAEKSGIYITWTSNNVECFRIGSESKCFCGHLFKKHNHPLTSGTKK